MDNGEVITGLNEDWTLGGAKLGEWMAGFVALILTQELVFHQAAARYMPILLGVWVGTTFTMAALRSRYEDEERGLRNQVLVAVGVTPPGIPSPASLQPYWSASPVHELSEHCEFMQLGIYKLFAVPRSQEEDDIETDVPWKKPIAIEVQAALVKEDRKITQADQKSSSSTQRDETESVTYDSVSTVKSSTVLKG